MDMEREESVNLTFEDEGEALHFAVQHNSPTFIRDLIHGGEHVDKTTKYKQQTPIHWCTRLGRLECLKCLRNNGGDLMVQDGTIDGNTPLHLAIQNGRTAIVRWLLEQDIDVNWKNRSGLTPLHCATMCTQQDLVLILLEAHADVNVRSNDTRGISALHVASSKGDLAVMETLINNGAELNAFCKKKKQSPLHWAVQYGKLEAAKLLVNMGADMNLKTDDEHGYHSIHLAVAGDYIDAVEWLLDQNIPVESTSNYFFTPLHIAANCNHSDIMKLLLTRNARLNPRVSEGDNNTPLEMAVFRGHIQAVTMLLEAGADPNVEHRINKLTALHYAARSDNTECMMLLLQYGGNIMVHVEGTECETLLVTAARYDAEKVARLLIDHSKIFIHLKDNQGLTPLHHTATNGSEKVAVMLLSEGAYVDAVSENCYKMTPLHYAVLRGQVGLVTILVAFNADLYAESSDNMNSLHMAAMRGDLSCLKVLEENEGNILTRTGNEQGDTPMHIAASFGHDEMILWLLQRGISVNITNSFESTPLMNATREGHVGLIGLLLKNGADVNMRSCTADSRTALHFASACGFEEAVRLLLENGADIEERTGEHSRTALHLATVEGRLGTTEILLAYGANVDARDQLELTPMDIAILKENDDLIAVLRKTNTSTENETE